ncbi:hypothetical protein [Agrobacterium bohemicum]|uniref:Uncharacterized protein n=1 Tax=Agrobacterium bohemicum TaxID=2052828 RepID=A0A135P0R1_9HYPH|nr:hypothetical protein [Agrobacterium bohemicum]KXG84976.1 hypothetical protein ATO67_10115 [Agrobacterium bohemicum]
MTSDQSPKIRPAQPADVPQIADLFTSVFRKRFKPDMKGLNTYLSQLLFSHPNYMPENGSMVTADGAGSVKSALITVPLSYRIGEEPVIARLACAFMAAEDANPRSIAVLIFQLRPRGDQISFSDSAAPVSVAHMKAIGGTELPVQGLRWYKIFKPISATGGYMRRRIAPRLPLNLGAGGLPNPSIIVGKPHASGYSATEAKSDVYAAYANQFLTPYAVAPVYTADSLEWTISMSSGPNGRGKLTLAQVYDENGDICGVFSFVGAPGGEAQILDLLSPASKKDAVLETALAALKDAGFAFVSAQLRTEMISALSKHHSIWYRHVTGVCASSRSSEFKQAMQNGQAYLGGIAGESWSRLVRDFY